MNEKQTQQIRQLVQDGNYTEARKLLMLIRDKDPDARQWLNTLDDVIAQRSDMPKNKVEARRRDVRWTSDRIIANIVASLVFFVPFGLMGGLITVLIFWLCDQIFNPPKRTVNQLIVTFILASGIGFGLRAASVAAGVPW